MAIVNYFFDKALWKRYYKQVIGFWLLFLLMILFIPFTFWMVSLGALGDLPTFEELENPHTALATEIYSSDSVLLGKFYSQNRTNVKFEQLSPNLVNALLATEDIRFLKHPGVDARAIMRALSGVLTLQSKGGGSTLTQQLATNLFHVRSTTLLERLKQKLKEQVIAVRLESRYTKEEILAMYLNTVEFNDNAFGISSAAYTYFKKDVGNLDIEEAAVLVGMLQNPSRFNPRRFPERSTARRNIVLYQMERYGFIDESTKETLSNPNDCPIVLNFQKSTHTEGIATYFREVLRLEMMKWANQPENMKLDSTKYDIYRDGLRIYTTIHSKVQRHAEAAVHEHLSALQKDFFKHWKDKDVYADPVEKKRFIALVKKSDRYLDLKESGIGEDSIMKVMKQPVRMKIFTHEGEMDTLMSPYDSIYYHRLILQTGFLVVNPEDGSIMAWVGGADYKYFQYDHINSRRQVGSTFKPFIYSKAIENGYSPCFKITDAPVTFEDYNNWTPKNSDEYSNERLTLFECLAKSKNTCSAFLMKQLGPEVVIQMMREMGITAPIEPVPAISLGSVDISAWEMAGAYTVFANKGIYTQPNYITSIQTKDGLELNKTSPESHDVMSEEQAYVMVELLRYVVNHGSGGRIRYRYKLTADVCGKTGTTNDNTDGWFMGFTPQFIGAVWTGGEDRVVRFRSTALGQGANMALPIWGLFAQKLYADKSLAFSESIKFAVPPGKLPVELDCSRYRDAANTLPGGNSTGTPDAWDNPNP